MDETAPEKTKKPNRATQIRLDMEAAGIYSPAYDATIRDLVKREHELRRAEKAWKAAYRIDGKQREPQMTVQLINKSGAPYMTPDPYYKQVEALRGSVEALRDKLGLTPRAMKRLKANVSESDAGGKSRLETLLEQAEDYAVDHAAEYAAEVDAYVDGVLAGEINACKTIVQSCERYRRDLDSGKWDFRREPACYIIAVMETLICHQRGQFLDARPLRGTPFYLLPYHKFIIFNVMGFYKPGTEERRFKEVLDFVPRKNVKTTFAAALAFALALYERESGSEVYIVGSALKQARQSFDFLGYNLHRLRVTADEDMAHGLRMIDNNAEHSFSGDVGGGYVSISALASNPDKQDSFNANIILADEMHAYKSAMQYQVLQDATQAYTNKLVIGISSGGRYAQGFCAKHVNYCRKVLSGEITGDAADEIFIFIASIGDDENGNPAYLDEKELAEQIPAGARASGRRKCSTWPSARRTTRSGGPSFFKSAATASRRSSKLILTSRNGGAATRRITGRSPRSPRCRSSGTAAATSRSCTTSRRHACSDTTRAWTSSCRTAGSRASRPTPAQRKAKSRCSAGRRTAGSR